MKMKVKTHTFRLGKYHIDIDKCEGFCDVPDQYTRLHMIILKDNGIKGLASALHEAMHAEGIPDKYIHDKDGYSDTERLARFLWRLGYRKVRK